MSSIQRWKNRANNRKFHCRGLRRDFVLRASGTSIRTIYFGHRWQRRHERGIRDRSSRHRSVRSRVCTCGRWELIASHAPRARRTALHRFFPERRDFRADTSRFLVNKIRRDGGEDVQFRRMNTETALYVAPRRSASRSSWWEYQSPATVIAQREEKVIKVR